MSTNNQQLRDLFTLPPIQPSASTALAIPEMPPQQTVTGDNEVDAVLWLQSVVKTGNQALIDKALEAAKRIKTPMEELGKQYAKHIAGTTGSALHAAFASFGFGELEDQAERAIQRAARRHEALSRFGDEKTLFTNTPAEDACVQALHRAKRAKYDGYDDAAAMVRFAKRPALVPDTIDDCLYAMDYWERLYMLRNAAHDHAGDPLAQTYAHEQYCFAMMASIRPRNGREAMRAFDYLQEDGRDQWNDSPAVLRNLIVSSWAAQEQGASA